MIIAYFINSKVNIANEKALCPRLTDSIFLGGTYNDGVSHHDDVLD